MFITNRNATTNFNIPVHRRLGYSENVTFTAVSSLLGVGLNLTPSSTSGSADSVLTLGVTVPPNAPQGNFKITLQGNPPSPRGPLVIDCNIPEAYIPTTLPSSTTTSTTTTSTTIDPNRLRKLTIKFELEDPTKGYPTVVYKVYSNTGKLEYEAAFTSSSWWGTSSTNISSQVLAKEVYIPVGAYIISAEAIGYKSYSGSGVLGEDGNTHVARIIKDTSTQTTPTPTTSTTSTTASTTAPPPLTYRWPVVSRIVPANVVQMGWSCTFDSASIVYTPQVLNQPPILKDLYSVTVDFGDGTPKQTLNCTPRVVKTSGGLYETYLDIPSFHHDFSSASIAGGAHTLDIVLKYKNYSVSVNTKPESQATSLDTIGRQSVIASVTVNAYGDTSQPVGDTSTGGTWANDAGSVTQ